MVAVAVWVLSIAVIAGTVLALLHLRATDSASRPPLAAGIAHGVVGAAGMIVLLLAMRGPPRGVEAGAGYFGAVSAWLFAGALATGIGILSIRQKALLIAIHGSIAVTGYVLLLAWSALN